MSEQKQTIYSRFIAAQAELPAIAQNNKAQAFKGGSYTYANINDILMRVTPILTRHGLCLMQNVTATETTVGVESLLFDVDGNKLSSGVFTVSTAGLMQKGVQAHGSAVTYARRYSLVAFLGLAYGTPDDDGQAACEHYYRPQRQAPATPLKPVQLSDEQRTAINSVKNSLIDCDDTETLHAIGKHIGALNLPQCDELADLRSMYAQANARINNKMTANEPAAE